MLEQKVLRSLTNGKHAPCKMLLGNKIVENQGRGVV
jgi:hypothetical protein